MSDSMPVTSTLEPGQIHGIPPRTSAFTTLWAHLLRKDPQREAQKSDIPLPPLTPLDKNGTSMRVLLHDTQAHLDKFSTRADSLLSGVDEAKHEISLVKTLFQRQHETLTEELVDLVNRAQTQLQTSIGSPAQADEHDRLSKDFSMHMKTLEKRLDAIQQISQTQGQTIQLLQEQQGLLLSTVLPLLPLLQALPLHIESARNKITDMLTIRTSRTLHSDPPSEDNSRSSINDRRPRNKRSSSTLLPDGPPHSSMRKKPRSISSTRASGLAMLHDGPITSPAFVAPPIRADVGSSLRGVVAVANQISSLTRNETTIVPNSQNTPIRQSTRSPDADATPRFFLDGALSPEQHRQLSNSSPLIQCADNHVQTPRANDVVCPLVLPLADQHFETSRSSMFPSSSRPRVPGRSLNQKSLHPLPNAVVSSVSPPSTSDMQHTKVFNPTNTLSSRTNGPSTVLINPACHPANATSSDDSIHLPLLKTPLSRQGVPSVRPPFSPSRWNRNVGRSTLASPYSKPTMVQTAGSSTTSVPELRVRERRSPLKEGRRFIPLDDSDDEIDNEMNS